MSQYTQENTCVGLSFQSSCMAEGTKILRPALFVEEQTF